MKENLLLIFPKRRGLATPCRNTRKYQVWSGRSRSGGSQGQSLFWGFFWKAKTRKSKTVQDWIV